MSTLLHKSGHVSPRRMPELDEWQVRQQEQARAERAKLYFKNCGVWPRYLDARLEDVALPRSVLTADEFAKYERARDTLATLLERPATLILRGGNGPGKTHLASALVVEFCRKGREARFVTANDFFLSLKSTFGEAGRTQEDVVRRFRAYDLLVVDEIEVRSDSNWENQQLRDLINARYSMVKSTLILTNKTRDEINGRDGTPYFSAAIRDRIRDDEGGIVDCNWPSLRGRSSGSTT
jgi:DNA replication protein DnaC